MEKAPSSVPPRNLGRPRRHPVAPVLIVAASAAIALIGIGAGDIVLAYQDQAKVSGTGSPFRFVNGGNYPAANSQGMATTTYPNSQQVALTTSVAAASGGFGTYLLDVVEVQANVTSTATWHLHLDVATALVASGVDAGWLSYCTAAPTAVPDTGPTLAQGTDANGNPWAIFAPTCSGTQVSLNLLTPGPGSSISFTGVTRGAALLYISYGLAVTNTGARTTTNAVTVLEATTP